MLAAGGVAAMAIGGWMLLPSDYVLRRALVVPAGDRVLTRSEGRTEVIAVVEAARGRALLTNGHAMSSTAPLDQRYMRALAHIPLLSMPHPRRVLVIGFGVGNTAHAATLHPSVERVDVAELSEHVLAHAGFFAAATGGVLQHPKVAVYLNDGRQHLRIASPATYDLVTLEPPPIAHAGVAALYSREFYRLVRSRLTVGGYVSQWLPAYQVPAESSLAMVRAFLDVFPQAVLLSGTQAELLLVGHVGAAPRDRSRSPAAGAGRGARRARGPGQIRPGRAARDRRLVRRLGGNPRRRHARVRRRDRRPADPGVRRAVGSVHGAAGRAGRALRPERDCVVVPALLRGRPAGARDGRSRRLSGAAARSV